MAESARLDIPGILGGLSQRVKERPYPTLAIGFLAGYVAGGGLFTRLTRPLARAALGALLVPGVRDRLRGAAADLGGARPAAQA